MKIGILFDLDGTLLDTLEDLYTATNHILRQYGCPERSMEEIRLLVGNGARMQITKALPGREDDPPLEQVLADYQAYYNATCKDGTAKPYPGVMEALEELKKDYPIAVVSNKPDPAVKVLAEKYFPGCFQVAIGDMEGYNRKPAPDLVYKALEELGAKKEEAIYVGDSDVDLMTAMNAELPCVSVTWGFRDREFLMFHGASVFIDKPMELLELL